MAWDGEVGNELMEEKDGVGFAGPSADLNQVLQSDAIGGRAAETHPRRGTWGRRSGNREMLAEASAGVGGSEQNDDGVR